MEFPITELLDYESSIEWILDHFHPKGMRCPNCKAPIEQSREFRHTRVSRLMVHRCRDCGAVYNLYTGTIFQGSHWTPMQVVLVMRGICKGETTSQLAAELKLNYKTVLNIRHLTQANAELEQPKTALNDHQTETDELFQNAGEKGKLHPDPEDPPRIRANKQRGHGTYENDRPPIVGTVGRESGQVRLRVVHHTDRKTLESHVHRFTKKDATCNTDEWSGYNHIIREHKTVCHAKHEWARDDDGDGIREVHTNTAEGMWTDVRNYLRNFKGVHKDYLSGYVAIAEFRKNLKRIAPAFITVLVALHTVYT